MFKRLLGGKGKGKRPPAKQQEAKEEAGLQTPATAPLRYDHDEDVDGQPLESEVDAQLHADNFLLRREQARQRNELAERKYREAQMTAALDDANEDRARLEERVMAFVNELHERDVLIRVLKQEKAEAEELLAAVAEYHAGQEQQGERAEAGKKEEEEDALLRRRLHRLLVTAAPGIALLFLLLLLAAAVPPVDHRLFGGLGGLLLFPSSSLWHNRASALSHLAPGHGVLHQGEYLRSCGGRGWLGMGMCEDPHVLHLDWAGHLVLYRGQSLFNHAGPVWTSGALTSYRMGLGAAARKGSKKSGDIKALVDAGGVLKVVKMDEAGGKGRKEVLFSRPVRQLPADLVRLELVKGK